MLPFLCLVFLLFFCVLNSFANLFPVPVFCSQHPLKLAYNFATENADNSLADCVCHKPSYTMFIFLFFLNNAYYKHEVAVELGKFSGNE